VCAVARNVDVVREEVAVVVRRRQVHAPVDDVEDDERRREDPARHPVDVLRRADPDLGVFQRRQPGARRHRVM